MPIIKISNLTKTFKLPKRNVEVLRGINLEVKTGDFVLIFGSSGCGKTTLLNLILGLETPTSGEIKVKGHTTSQLKPKERAAFRLENFACVYQTQTWLKALNILDNVALPLYLRASGTRLARSRARDVLSSVGMEKVLYSRPNELSSGEQQRVGLARAIICNAPIIIADEPTGNLDSTTSDEVMNIFDMLNKRYKKTIILVTHNQAYWGIGSKRIEMQDGKVAIKNES